MPESVRRRHGPAHKLMTDTTNTLLRELIATAIDYYILSKSVSVVTTVTNALLRELLLIATAIDYLVVSYQVCLVMLLSPDRRLAS